MRNERQHRPYSSEWLESEIVQEIDRGEDSRNVQIKDEVVVDLVIYIRKKRWDRQL